MISILLQVGAEGPIQDTKAVVGLVAYKMGKSLISLPQFFILIHHKLISSNSKKKMESQGKQQIEVKSLHLTYNLSSL